MVRHVSALGATAHVLSCADIVTRGRVAIDSESPSWVEVDGAPVNVLECAGFWLWHAERPAAADADPFVARYVRREWELAIRAIAAVTPRERWINHPADAEWLEGNKLEQMRLAALAGFDVPQTLLSNDPDEIVRFAERFERVAVKSQGGAWKQLPDGTMTAGYTQRCTSSELDAHRAALRRAPVLVQPYLEKIDELRVTVIDSAIFACRIDSQASARSMVDWRRHDPGQISHDLIDLSPQDAARVAHLVALAKLRYAAIDLLRATDGRTYFLDLNPQGQFAWIEALTQAPIGRTLAEALVRR